jgi:hypothetical protein
LEALGDERLVWMQQGVEVAFKRFVEQKWKDSLNVKVTEPMGMNQTRAGQKVNKPAADERKLSE